MGFVAAMALLGAGCAGRHLARTVGQGHGEVRAGVGGPLLSNLGPPIPLPNLAVQGRYGLTDWLDVDGGVSVLGLAYGLFVIDAGLVAQLYRQPRGFALSASARGNFFFDLDDGFTPRGYPEVGLHAEQVATDWLVVFGGLDAWFVFSPPPGKPPVLAAPYLGAEVRFGGSAEGGHPHGLSVQAAWISPWQNSTSVIDWEPADLGALSIVLGFTSRFGGLDR